MQSSYLKTIGIFTGFQGEGIVRNLYTRLLNIRCLHTVFRNQHGFEVERLRQFNGFPRASKVTPEPFYVDVGVVGAYSIEGAIQVREELQRLFSLGGFEIEKVEN